MNYKYDALLTEKRDAEVHRTMLHGPKPINVFTEMRQALNLSHVELAKRIHISKQALIRLEQGTFNQPLPTVVDYYVKYHGYNELTILDAYEHYRYQTRRRYTGLFGPHLSFDINSSQHPFRQLRDSIQPPVNPSEVAKYLCVPQATIQHFERKWKTQQTVPKELNAALHAIGYTYSEINQFNDNYESWRRAALNARQQQDGSAA
jgi:DNA-binding XRE family transcriptional regulator